MAVFFSFSFFFNFNALQVLRDDHVFIILVLMDSLLSCTRTNPRLLFCRYKGIFPVINVIGSDKRKKELGLFLVSAKLGES